MVKTWVWIVIVAVLAVVSVAAALLLWFAPAAGTVANVYVDGELVYSVDLGSVTEAYQYVVKTPYGANTLAVERGRIRVLDTDCAGHDCMRQGWISRAGNPIVCIPHHLVVQISGDAGNEVVL